MTMCGFIFHNFLIDHAIPQDWMVNSMELEEDKELEHHHATANLCDQTLDYMQDIRYVTD